MNAAPSSVVIHVLPSPDLSRDDWDDVWTLTQRFYDTERGYAEAKLRTSQEIALLRSRADGALVGMAALDLFPIRFDGRDRLVIFTSHVLLDERHRGRNLFQRLAVRTFLRARARFPLRPACWMFDTFSYKSYLLLPRNFREYWPRRDRPTPEPVRALMDHVARRHYGQAWQPEHGIVLRSGRKRLRPQTAPLDADLLRDPDLAFFARANPGHAEGDMLVCLCPLTVGNWLSVGMSALRRVVRRRGGSRRPAGA